MRTVKYDQPAALVATIGRESWRAITASHLGDDGAASAHMAVARQAFRELDQIVAHDDKILAVANRIIQWAE